MWYEVRPQDEKMVMIDGLTGKQSIPILEQVISALEKSPEKFKAMNPENGWGSYDGFLQFLKELLAGAIKSPACRWKTWR